MAEVSDWHTLGIQLDLRGDQLDEIEQSHPTAGVVRWKSEVLKKWLHSNTNASWENVVSALQNMKECELAERIRRKYIGIEKAVAGMVYRLAAYPYCRNEMHKSIQLLNM